MFEISIQDTILPSVFNKLKSLTVVSGDSLVVTTIEVTKSI
jgi:hypothetical protein